jgi:hypothetical protein
MYNKPITQRVAFAISKKASALKQASVDDTTVLNTVIPPVTETATVNLPDTTETITTTKENPKLTEFKARCGKFGGKNSPEAAAAGCVWADDAKDPDPITVDETITTPGGQGEAEVPLYQYDRGDSMPSWMQRKVYRGLKVGERQQKKALKSQLKEGAITKAEYKQGLKDAATKRANASNLFAETQAESARQGQTFGKQGTTMIGTFDPNTRVTKVDDATRRATVGRVKLAVDTTDPEQKIEAQEDAVRLAGDNANRNQATVNNSNTQTETTDVVSSGLLMRNFGPLKMKSSFKMGGYGNKTYKK